MKKPKATLPSKAEYLEKAAARYDRLTRTPGPVGRPSQHDIDTEAIREIAKISAGISSHDVGLWKQSKWVEEILKHKGEWNPSNRGTMGKVTIQKHLKGYIQSMLFPMHLIPVSIIRKKTPHDQLLHWLAWSIALATMRVSTKGGFSLSLPMIDALHRKLCAAYILKADRLTEGQRQAWCVEHFGRIEQVQPSRQTTSSTPRKPKKA